MQTVAEVCAMQSVMAVKQRDWAVLPVPAVVIPGGQFVQVSVFPGEA